MAFERNDIVNKTRLMGELGEELMGFEHNDIVTVDVMNEAIAEGGGGGGDYPIWHVTVNTVETLNAFANYSDDHELKTAPYVNNKPYTEYSVVAGSENFDLGFMVFDDSANGIASMDGTGFTYAVTGDVTVSVDEYNWWEFHVTGDGTITITAA